MLTFTQCKPPYENGTFTDPLKLHFMMAVGISTSVDTHVPGEVGERTKGLYRISCMMGTTWTWGTTWMRGTAWTMGDSLHVGDSLDVGDRLDMGDSLHMGDSLDAGDGLDNGRLPAR